MKKLTVIGIVFTFLIGLAQKYFCGRFPGSPIHCL